MAASHSHGLKSMTAKTFVDTNILLYAYDRAAGWKHEACKQEIQRLWLTQSGVLSTQVMQEFYVNATRKLAEPMSLAQAREEISLYEAWEPVSIRPPLIRAASHIQETAKLSFWDALIVAAAQEAGAELLLSEDLNHGQFVGKVRIHNPLLNQVQDEAGVYKS